MSMAGMRCRLRDTTGSGLGGPDTALSVWVVEQQEVTEETPAFQSLLFLRHPDIQSDVWATLPPRRSVASRSSTLSAFSFLGSVLGLGCLAIGSDG